MNRPSAGLRGAGWDEIRVPADVSNIYGWLGAADKEIYDAPGNHVGRPIGADGGNGQIAAGKILREWIGDRFPVR